MKEDLTALNKIIRSEADDILYRMGLQEVLIKYGIPHVSGSYELELMTWRDLDLYLESDAISESRFFQLGQELVELMHPVKMNYRNERQGMNTALPKGLYWGVYLGDEREGDWKIDIWAVETAVLKHHLEYCNEIKRRLTPEARNQIMEIKTAFWKHPGYRRSFTSTDIYLAVLNDAVAGVRGFEDYLRKFIIK